MGGPKATCKRNARRGVKAANEGGGLRLSLCCTLRMKHISILVLQDAVLSSIDVAKQVFTKVNEFLQYRGQRPLHKIKVKRISKETLLNRGTFNSFNNTWFDG